MTLHDGYHSPQVEVAVRLNTNESPEGPPPEFLAELAEIAAGLHTNRYPDRQAVALRAAVGQHHGLGGERVFCANGSNEVLQCLLLAYGGGGRSALVFEPTYALHSHIARLTGTEVLTGGRDDRFVVELESALAIVESKQPDVVFFCSPNNPTGNSESRETIEAVAKKTGGLVIVDEAYAQFSSWSAIELLASLPNVVVVRTFSKTWALAGLRLGYMLGDPSIVETAAKVALPYHLDSFKQQAGVAALAHEEAMVARVARLVGERGRVFAALGAMPVDLWPSDSNFILFRPQGREAGELWSELVASSVLVRDVSSFPGLEGCLRVTIGTPEENGAFLAALGDALGTRR